MTSFSRGETLAGSGSSLKQLVRIKATIKATVSATQPAWAYVRITPLSWARN